MILASGARGRGFDSHLAPKPKPLLIRNRKKREAFVAQVAEHSPSKRKVKGSNPFGGYGVVVVVSLWPSG